MSDSPSRPIRTAVVTGHHPFDVPGFHAVFRSIPGIDWYPQQLDDFAVDAGKVRDSYEVVVFYNFHQQTPTGEEDWWNRGTRDVLERLGSGTQGIFLLHHAILAYPHWQHWSDICGIQNRDFGYHPNQRLQIDIADHKHPITAGLAPWSLIDETYTMDEPSGESQILLTTTHQNSMRSIAWTRRFRHAPVFCFQSGHDNQTYANQGFRTIVARGIQWLAGRI